MMWFDDFKEFSKLAGGICKHGTSVRTICPRCYSEMVAECDRLTTIAKKLEWSWMIWGHRACHLCLSQRPSGHKTSCPHHEDWTP